ncbi:MULTISPECIES: hypothetical protein [unclassified Gilliamella]
MGRFTQPDSIGLLDGYNTVSVCA